MKKEAESEETEHVEGVSGVRGRRTRPARVDVRLNRTGKETIKTK